MRLLAAPAGLVCGALLCATPAAAQTQAQMNASAGTDYRRADVAMTAQWKATYAYMKREDAQNAAGARSPGYAAATLASQRAWLTFRNAQCAIEAKEVEGGSMAPMVRAGCLTRLTKERTKQLKDLMWRR
ncbi:lysozyme inhibitor LprI family protein [Sphingomonas sp. TZW2008]|uniref:lysozyme inhibitor LprI family protein n=1 Tax=Sphingomonas sp. TZW2008 TaxID=1917973 RepID=UPI00211A8BCC|nr:lysozyme inhibitor LprI family protein [Sphingomonas sp. TZW2008]